MPQPSSRNALMNWLTSSGLLILRLFLCVLHEPWNQNRLSRSRSPAIGSFDFHLIRSQRTDLLCFHQSKAIIGFEGDFAPKFAIISEWKRAIHSCLITINHFCETWFDFKTNVKVGCLGHLLDEPISPKYHSCETYRTLCIQSSFYWTSPSVLSS